MGFIGLDINVPDPICGKLNPVDSKPCLLPAGHESDPSMQLHHSVMHEGPCDHRPEFEINCDSPEVAQRVHMSYVALSHLSLEQVMKLANGEHHLHIAHERGENCKPEGDKDDTD